MTKRKRRALEQARLEEQRQQERRRKQPDFLRPRVLYGPVNSDDTGALPIINSSVKGVQMPPIIQPISLLPYLSELNFNFPREEEEFIDDFDDDFDDMF